VFGGFCGWVSDESWFDDPNTPFALYFSNEIPVRQIPVLDQFLYFTLDRRSFP
jgi:hypothetical protein